MPGVWEATVKTIRAENGRRLREAKQSLAALKNQTGWYAADHRKLIALRLEIDTVIERHIYANDEKRRPGEPEAGKG